MEDVKHDNDSDWLKYLPVTGGLVSVDDFAEMVNSIWCYIYAVQEEKLTPYLVERLLTAKRLISELSRKSYKILPQGEKYIVLSKDGKILLTSEGQAFVKDFYLNNGISYSYDFAITEEQADKFSYSEKPVTLSSIQYRINNLIDTSFYRMLKLKDIADFLVDEGLLDIVRVDDEHFFRRATKKGNKHGIVYREYTAGDGNEYLTNLYDKNAQFYIVENLEKISEFSCGKRTIRESRLKGIPNEPIAEEPKEVKKCKFCAEYKRGCPALNDPETCADYRAGFSFSQKEIENWPKEGDASYYRRKGKSRDY